MRFLIGLLLCTMAMPAGIAFAQDEPAPEPAPATAPVAATMDAGEVDDVALQTEWGENRVIRTLQRRLFTKFGRSEFTFYLGIVPNDPFVFYMPVGLRYNYHFNEAFALEAAASFVGCFTGDVGDNQERGIDQGCLRVASDLKAGLEEEKKERTQVSTIKLLDQQVLRADITAAWSPVFGKVAVLNDSLIHFDFNLVGGAGFLLTESIDENDLSKVNFRPTFEGVVGAGFKFYFAQRFGVRLDFRQFIYPKEAGGTANPSEISLGFSVFTD